MSTAGVTGRRGARAVVISPAVRPTELSKNKSKKRLKERVFRTQRLSPLNYRISSLCSSRFEQ